MIDAEPTTKISAVVVVNDFEKFSTHTEETLLKRNEEVIDDRIIVDNVGNRSFTSLARALNWGLDCARNRVIICCHQDVKFGADFLDLLQDQCSKLPNDWAVVGTVGLGFDGNWYWGSDTKLTFPVRVQTLDELCLIIRKDSGLRFDEDTFDGFHCYGADLCLQAHSKRLGVYVIKARWYHPKGGAFGDPLLQQYKKRLLRKWWKRFPSIHLTTGGVRITRQQRALWTLLDLLRRPLSTALDRPG